MGKNKMNADMAAIQRVLDAGAETDRAWDVLAAIADEAARRARDADEDALARVRFAEMLTGKN
jgi:hypothetical protein